MNPHTKERHPIKRQNICYPNDNEAHLTAFPPYSTIKICTAIVTIITNKNNGLLKNP